MFSIMDLRSLRIFNLSSSLRITVSSSVKYVSKFGTFEYRHIQRSLFFGYHSIKLNNQIAFIAEPEKALLDFFYLTKIKVSHNYMDEMRLQNLDKIDVKKMFEYAKRYKSKRVLGAFEMLSQYIENYKRSEKQL